MENPTKKIEEQKSMTNDESLYYKPFKFRTIQKIPWLKNYKSTQVQMHNLKKVPINASRIECGTNE